MNPLPLFFGGHLLVFVSIFVWWHGCLASCRLTNAELDDGQHFSV